MFGWISNVFHSVVSGVTDAVKSFVNLLVNGLYSFLHGIFRLQWDAWNDFWNGAYAVWAGVRSLSIATYHRFIDLYRSIIPYLDNYIHWVRVFLGAVINQLNRALRAVIEGVYHWALATFDAFRKWVINSVWTPLFKSLTAAWDWLTHEGATIWHYFTNLADFAELLFWHILASLEKHAWDAAKYLGQFFLALIVKNLVEFVTLIEDIIDAVL